MPILFFSKKKRLGAPKRKRLSKYYSVAKKALVLHYFEVLVLVSGVLRLYPFLE